MNTPREVEIQEMAINVLTDIGKLVETHLSELNSSMELCYYLKQITTRIEILMNMRFDPPNKSRQQ